MTERPTNRATVLFVACLAQFMVVLDVAIVNVALPSIQRDLHISQGTLQWIVVAYGLTLGGFLLLGGRMADLLGRRRVLLTGLSLFSGASLLAGVAGSSGFLISVRALQGFGAALIPPAALSFLAVTFAEGAERNRALGIYGATTGISASVGVIASGLLTDGPGWRWVFFINVPIGIMLIAMAAVILPGDEAGREPRLQFDVAGAGTVTGGLLLMVYALSRTASHGWTSASTLGLFAATIAMLSVFVAVEARSRSPLVPGVAIRNRMLIAANLSAFLLFGALFSFIFLGSLLMQQVLGYSPTRTGVAWLATTATSFVAAAVTGAKLVGVVGVRRLLVAGFSIFALAALLLTRLPAGAHYSTGLLPVFILVGLAGGVSAPAIQIGALSGVPHELTGLAGGFVETLREVGGAVAVAAASTVLASRAASIAHAANPSARRPQTMHAFHAAFAVTFVIAVIGVLTAGIAFPHRTQDGDVEPTADHPELAALDAHVAGHAAHA